MFTQASASLPPLDVSYRASREEAKGSPPSAKRQLVEV